MRTTPIGLTEPHGDSVQSGNDAASLSEVDPSSVASPLLRLVSSCEHEDLPVIVSSVIWERAPATVEILLAVALTASGFDPVPSGENGESQDASSDLLQSLD